MKKIILALLILGSFPAFAQDPQYYRVKKKNKLVELTPYDNSNIVMYQISGLFESARKVVYVDSANTFKVTVPKWLKLKETNSLNFFGGTLPPINTIENAIAINSIKKNEYPTLTDFKKFIIEDSSYIKGATPKWANDRFFLDIQKDTVLFNKYSSYKVTVNRKGNVFVSNFILIETKTAYLWVQFTATEDTYPVNVLKFKDFMKELETDI